MKKSMLLSAALGALLCVSLTACTVNISDETVTKAANAAASVLSDADISVNGQPVDISVDSNGDINVKILSETLPAAETVSTAPAAVTKSPAAEITTAAPVETILTAPPAEPLQNAEMTEISKKLLNDYCFIADCMTAGWLLTDKSQTLPSDLPFDYCLVIEPDLQCMDDIPVFLAKTLTGNEFKKYVDSLMNCDIYTEYDGRLYASWGARGSAYDADWDWDGLRFTNVSANSFTVTATFLKFEQYTMEQTFDIVQTADGYRISYASELTGM